MQAALQFTNGLSANDSDHTFTTQALPASLLLNVTTTTTPGMTPQPGIELMNPLNGTPSGLLATDLSGNVLWAYANPSATVASPINGAKMLPNGDFLLAMGIATQASLRPGLWLRKVSVDEIREINLAGDTVREISIADLNAALASASCAECNVPPFYTFHHDVTPLPNGHWLVLANAAVALSSTTVPPLTNLPATTVLGDIIIDLDQNMKPVWVWNEFNHLDPNRHPYSFPDWTHTNAVLYSPDDGNLLVSMPAPELGHESKLCQWKRKRQHPMASG